MPTGPPPAWRTQGAARIIGASAARGGATAAARGNLVRAALTVRQRGGVTRRSSGRARARAGDGHAGGVGFARIRERLVVAAADGIEDVVARLGHRTADARLVGGTA